MKKNNNTDFNINNINQTVTLYGWVAKKRNLGGVIFIDLRDRSGLIQLVIKPDNSYYEIAQTLKCEYVIKAEGKIIEEQQVDTELLNEGNIVKILKSFIGKQEQIPPIYSAIKINGKKLYEYAKKLRVSKELERIIALYVED